MRDDDLARASDPTTLAEELIFLLPATQQTPDWPLYLSYYVLLIDWHERATQLRVLALPAPHEE